MKENLKEDDAVAILLATHNNASTIEQALESIEKQTFRNFKLYVVCDGSSDGTCEILSNFLPSDFEFHFLDLPKNVGKPLALNLLIAQVHEQWLAILDGDDIWVPNKLAIQMEFLSAHPEVSLLGGAIQRFGDWGTQQIITPVKLADDEIRAAFRKGKMPINNPTVIFQKSAYLSVGGFRGHLRRCEDFDLFLRMSYGDVVFANLNQVLVKYRTSSEFQSRLYWHRNTLTHIRILFENKHSILFRVPLYFIGSSYVYIRFVIAYFVFRLKFGNRHFPQ